MLLKLPKNIVILSNNFKITYNKNSNGGYFSWKDNILEIGTKDLNDNPIYVYSVISHEIMEVILVGLGGRFENNRTMNNYLFNFDHQTFENAMQLHSECMIKFIK